MKKTVYLLSIFTLINLITACTSQKKINEDLLITVIPPKNFNPEETVHIYGNFNNWQLEGNNAYKLNYKEGKLKVKVPINKDNLFFSFVKNKNYSNSPASKKGKIKPLYIYEGNSKKEEIEITIPLWTGDKPLKETSHTLTGNIECLKDFNMPQLNRKSDINIYLPPSYSANNTKSYPVLYMLDGQNVFDEFTAFSSEWQVDEIMEQLISEKKINEIIVVAIPNGERRWNEYAPWDYINQYLGDGKTLTKGEGENTMQFITKTLKPLIDKKYRTKTTAKNTGFAGSSLGGLMALYAGMKYGDTFGFVGAFSPSLALVNTENENILLKNIQKNKFNGNSRIYFDMGKVEYDGYKEIDILEKALLENGVQKYSTKLVKDDLGRHCEEDWSKRFPAAIQWMLMDLN